jgi:C1A family cysteine protease
LDGSARVARLTDMRLGLAIVAGITAALFATNDASAQQLPTVPGIDVPGLLQQAPGLLQQAQQVASCPTIEVAPNVRIPVCPNVIPKPPPGVVLPEWTFPAIAVPSAVDLRTRGLDGPVMNQQQTGVCYAFAITDVLDNSMRRQGRGDTLSPLHLVAAGGYSSLFSGPGEALDQENAWPYDPRKACEFKTGSDTCEGYYHVRTNSWQSDPQLVVERNRAKTMGVATIQKATTITRDPINGIVNALAGGRSIYLVIGIDSAAWGYSGVRDGMLKDYGVADRGDHAVAIVGYRWVGLERQFLLHNSWGTDWGDHGFVWIGEGNLKRHFSSAYLVDAIPGASATPAVPVLPQIPGFPALPQLQHLPPMPFPFPAIPGQK